jgi:hypothetical protein
MAGCGAWTAHDANIAFATCQGGAGPVLISILCFSFAFYIFCVQ